MDITSLVQAYKDKSTSPTRVVREIYETVRLRGERPVWIALVSEDTSLARASELEGRGDIGDLPLFGIPFAVKDNFDVEGMPTTAGCPGFAYQAAETAFAVQRLLDAGAILIGKTNMDQFATGLVGTRTPYGVCSSVFNPAYISGGSSSGSAVAVAQGLVSFSLGTDTAGSGRVPAAFNQLVGVKPTRGLVSTMGLLPACRSLDCVSIFAETCSDAAQVSRVVSGLDPSDAYSRAPKPGEGASPWSGSSHKVGVPTEDTLEFFGDDQARACYASAVAVLTGLGAELIRFDFDPLKQAASLLYNGPWVAERLAAIRRFATNSPSAIDATVATIITGASRFSAVDAFLAEYELKSIHKKVDQLFAEVDYLFLPTAPTHYKIAEVMADPLELNTNLGYYTNFVNLLDLAAVAVPGGFRNDGLPFGVSLVGRAFTDDALLAVADRIHRKLSSTLGGSERLLAAVPMLAPETPKGCVLMAVVGAHLTGQPLNWQLQSRRARFMRSVRTAADYRLFVLPDSTPPKPGLIHSPGFEGKGIELEVWAMPEDTVGSFLLGIPAPLTLGTVRLEDGTIVKGFLCESAGIQGAEEITHQGGWRAYMSRKG